MKTCSFKYKEFKALMTLAKLKGFELKTVAELKSFAGMYYIKNAFILDSNKILEAA